MYDIIHPHIPSFNFCNFLPLSSNPWLISWPTTIPIAPYAAALKKIFAEMYLMSDRDTTIMKS